MWLCRRLPTSRIGCVSNTRSCSRFNEASTRPPPFVHLHPTSSRYTGCWRLKYVPATPLVVYVPAACKPCSPNWIKSDQTLNHKKYNSPHADSLHSHFSASPTMAVAACIWTTNNLFLTGNIGSSRLCCDDVSSQPTLSEPRRCCWRHHCHHGHSQTWPPSCLRSF
jgi:hypothetical protein